MKTSKILAVDLVKIDSFLYCWSTSVDSRSLHGMLVSVDVDLEKQGGGKV